MKKITTLGLALCLALTTAGSAQADWGRHDNYRADHGSRHDRGQRGGSDWVGPVAILAIAGLAIGAATYNQYRPTPVYVAPPPPVQEQLPAGNWYYCGSANQYYPYVDYCPEGWQQVMPPR